jgi:hypothetical protein
MRLDTGPPLPKNVTSADASGGRHVLNSGSKKLWQHLRSQSQRQAPSLERGVVS